MPALARRSPARPPSSPRFFIVVAQLDPVVVGSLEVVAQDLLVLADAIACGPFEPIGEPLVELGPFRLGQGIVGGVTDQDVAELIRVTGK